MHDGKRIIDKERFYLREWMPGDGKYHYLLNADSDVVKFTGDIAFTSEEAAERFNIAYDQFEKYGCGRWLIFLKDNVDFVGWCGVKYHEDTDSYDLGFRLLKKYWGMGLATESSKAVLDWAKLALPGKTILAKAAIDNHGSINVLKKLGFQVTGQDEDHGMQVIVFELPKVPLN